MWYLIITMGISWAGAGAVQQITYPNEQACYKALSNMNWNTNGQNHTGGNGRQAFAICSPNPIKR